MDQEPSSQILNFCLSLLPAVLQPPPPAPHQHFYQYLCHYGHYMGELISCTPVTLILLNDKQNVLAEGRAWLVTPGSAAGAAGKSLQTQVRQKGGTDQLSGKPAQEPLGVFASTRVTAREERRIFCFDLECKCVI